MGRKSPITEKQWEQIGKRVLAGESIRALSREYGVSDAGIRKRFSVRTKEIKDVANQLVAAEIAYQNLPFSSQRSARTLADTLLAIQENMTSAALFGAASANQLQGIAHKMVQKLNQSGPESEEDMEALKRVAYVTRASNEAAQIPLDMLKGSKDKVEELNRVEAPEQMNWTINAVAAVSNAG